MRCGLTLLFAVFLHGLTAQEAIGILFAGNSLTYFNDLPAMVGKIAAAEGKTLRCEMLCAPNYALEDHWMEGNLQKQIARGEYDFVVVQQGPSSQAEGREMLKTYGEKIREKCERQGARLAFYMVWPALSYYHTIDGVIESYTQAAAATQSLLCPAGRAWKRALARKPGLPLYGSDRFHPSPTGSLLASLSIFYSLFPDEEAADLPYEVVRDWVSEEDFEVLKEAISE